MKTTTENKISEREAILGALSAWIRQRPGLEFGNYGDVSAYRSEMRRITRQKHDAQTLLSAVALRQSIGAEELKAAFSAYSGRLEWDSDKRTLSYTTGQYWPTEYRAAACAVLGQALFYHFMDCCPKDQEHKGSWTRTELRREFGARLQRRWLD